MLIEVHAASVNPIDVLLRGGYGASTLRLMKQSQEKETHLEFPITLGRDFSGVVVKTGRGIHKSQFKPGDEVWGALGPTRPGTHAQYVLGSAKEISKKPASLSHVEAASIPYVATTTWAAMCTAGGMTRHNARGKRVLLLGASGGLGLFATQLFKAWGAEVTATCRSDAADLVLSHGADITVDYTTPSAWRDLEHLQGFDYILDTVGGDAPEHALNLLRQMNLSKYISIKTPLLNNNDQFGVVGGLAKSALSLGMQALQGYRSGNQVLWAFFVPNSKALEHVAQLVDQGRIKPVVEKVFPFEEGHKAFEKVEGKHTRGKTVIDMKS